MFAGDIDNQVPAIGLERWVDSLALPVREGWRAWTLEQGGVVAGSVTSYGSDAATGGGGGGAATGLLYVTVRGAGHSVLRDRPQAAAQMFEWFLRGERFDGRPAPPPLPAAGGSAKL